MQRRLLKVQEMILVAVVILAIPTVIVSLLGWSTAVMLAMLAAMAGLFGAAGNRYRGLALLTVASGVSTFLAVLVAGSPIASGLLMVVVGAALGLVNKWGLSLWNFMFPVMAAAVISQPPKIVNELLPNALMVGLITMGCLVIPALLVGLVIKNPLQKTIPYSSRKTNVLFTFNLALLFGGAGYAASTVHDELLGTWLAMSVVAILIHPYAGQMTSRALQRGAGTTVGFLIAIGVAASALPDSLYYAAGLVFLEVAIFLKVDPKREYWEYVLFLTPGVVLLSGTPSQVGSVGNDRLGSTIVAMVACLVVLGIERLIFWRSGLAAPEAQAAAPATAAPAK